MNVVIFGTTEFSEYIYYTMKAENVDNVIAFTMTRDYIKFDTYCDLPVWPFEELDRIINEPFEILLTVSYRSMNIGREKIYKDCKERGYKVYTFISTRAVCDSNAIGEGCIVMPMVYIPPLTNIGVCNVINVAAIFGHTSTVGNYNWFSGNCVFGGNVTIEDYCFFGMNSLIKNGLNVASKTMLAAYSYLNEDSKENKFYSGNPAVNFKNLNADVVCDFI